jgi:UDP-glucose 4-epimerase
VRVLVAGMGSAIGTGVARALERSEQVEAIAGFDLEPPRRWMRRADFQFARPSDNDRVSRIVAEFQPTVVVNAWVFEPRARSSPGQARARTVAGTESLLRAISRIDTVEHIVVRSGVSVYGSGRGTPERPTIDTLPRPTSTFGDMLARVEERTAQAATELGATMSTVRLAPIMASHLPNPLGRYLRLPIVPIPMTTKRFGVVHLVDAGRSIAAAATHKHQGTLNVMASDPVTPLEAITIGRRVPVPMLPAAFRLGRFLAEIPGTPVPEHIAEVLSRGGVVTPSDMSKLGVTMTRTTKEALQDLYSAGRLIDVDLSRSVPLSSYPTAEVS